MLHEAWERVCPQPRWTLTCELGEAQHIKTKRAQHDIISPMHGADDKTSWMPEWPSPERAKFKGGTSLPLPAMDSESSGPEDFGEVQFYESSVHDGRLQGKLDRSLVSGT